MINSGEVSVIMRGGNKKISDAVVRSINVYPFGRSKELKYNGVANNNKIKINKNNIKEAIIHYENTLVELKKLEDQQKRSKIKNEKIESFKNTRYLLSQAYLSENMAEKAKLLIDEIPNNSVEKYELMAAYYSQIGNLKTSLSIYTQLKNKLNTNRYDSIISSIKKKYK